MVIVSSSEDPKSFCEFDCLLDAEVYYEVAKESLPKDAHLVMLATTDSCDMCQLKCEFRR